MVQALAERSCRSSVTPHKAESRGGNAGENFVDSRKPGSAGTHMPLQQPGGYSNSSQAAHESQAGISVSVKPVDVCVPAALMGRQAALSMSDEVTMTTGSSRGCRWAAPAVA